MSLCNIRFPMLFPLVCGQLFSCPICLCRVNSALVSLLSVCVFEYFRKVCVHLCFKELFLCVLCVFVCLCWLRKTRGDEA